MRPREVVQSSQGHPAVWSLNPICTSPPAQRTSLPVWRLEGEQRFSSGGDCAPRGACGNVTAGGGSAGASSAGGLLPTILQRPGQFPLAVVQPKASVAPRLRNLEPSTGQKDVVSAAQLIKTLQLSAAQQEEVPTRFVPGISHLGDAGEEPGTFCGPIYR